VLVGVTDDKADGTARRYTIKHTTQQPNLILFLSTCGNVALSGTPPVQFLLDKVHVNGYASRHAVNDTANSFAVTLAKRGQSE
jgi:hypothetical protein